MTGQIIGYAPGDSDQRPSGTCRAIHVGDGFIRKQIDVNRGAKLSLQNHKHRSDSWTFLAGRGQVTRDDEAIAVAKGDVVAIPALARHRIENKGDGTLTFIEIQRGASLHEFDIVRYEDVYGRA